MSSKDDDSAESHLPAGYSARGGLRVRPKRAAHGLRGRGLHYGLLLICAALAGAAIFLLLQGRGTGARWTVVLSLVLAGAMAGDRRLRARLALAWWQILAFAADGKDGLPWRPALLLVALPNLLLLLAHGPGLQTGDSRPVIMTAASLITDGDLEVSEFADVYRRNHWFTVPGEDLPYFLVERPEGLFSHYPLGMVPFALPVVAAARSVGAHLTEPIVQQHLEQVTAALVATGCITIFFLLALHIVRPATALIGAAILATGSVVYSTLGQALWQHGGVIVSTELLLLVEFRSWRRPSWQATGLQGLAMATMLSCRLSSALIAATFGLWVALRSPSRAIKLAGAAGLAFAPWLALYWSVYKNLAGPMSVQTNGFFWSFGAVASWGGVLCSPTHGLFVYQPWLLLGLLAIGRRPRDTEREGGELPPGWQTWALAVIGLHLAMVSGWWCWWGGLCWGSRLAAEAVPLAALLCLQPLAALMRSGGGRKLVLAFATLSLLLHVPSVWLRQDRWYDGMGGEEQLAHAWCWRTPPFLYPWLTFADSSADSASTARTAPGTSMK
ncbi:MAG TPA: hypothetical protein VHC22_19095 [Pirellulales bacterium]|nr:hypothetical protein [Pirellulales bacterium]